MTMAKGRCESEPMPCDVAAGSRPRVATSMVIIMGRRRRTAPSMAASSMVWPRTRIWLMYSSMMTPIFDRDAEEGEEADAGGDAEVGPGEEQRGEAAHRRHGDGDEDEQGPLTGVEHGVEQHKDDDEGDREHDHQPAGGALLAGILSGPVDLVADGQGDLCVDFVDGLFDGGAKVSSAHAVFDGDVALAGLAVDLLGAVLGLDGSELGEGDALAGHSGCGICQERSQTLP